MAFSVVIPTLARPTLTRALESVARQSKRPREVILIANGPEPPSLERMVELEEVVRPIRFRCLTLPPFSGPSICRNLGAFEAAGTYVAFLDDDDEFDRAYLGLMHEAIILREAEFLYGSRVWRDVDGATHFRDSLALMAEKDWFEALYRHLNPGFGGTNLVAQRAAFLELGGFPVDLPSAEDRAFAMSALHSGRSVAFVGDAMVICHEPIGYRATGRPDKWISNLKLMNAYWGSVNWTTRLHACWRWLRSLLPHFWRRRS